VVKLQKLVGTSMVKLQKDLNLRNRLIIKNAKNN